MVDFHIKTVLEGFYLTHTEKERVVLFTYLEIYNAIHPYHHHYHASGWCSSKVLNRIKNLLLIFSCLTIDH